jgi:hypothetical protein
MISKTRILPLQSFRNPSRDIASRQFFLETLLESIGFFRVEALANELASSRAAD